MEINIINLQKKIPLNTFLLAKIKRAVILSLREVSCFARSRRSKPMVNICLADDKKIRLLNEEFLNKDTSTDVIAFEIDNNAEVIISTDKAVSNSRIFKTTPVYELLLYVVHGIMHVLGYDDRTQKQRAIMQRKEISILNNSKLHL